jgi:tetratricopeptide (TPR) repeat protein
MTSIAWKSLIAVMGILALASKPAVGQDQEKAGDLATCGDATKAANARLQACTRSLDRERNGTKRRQAVILTYRALALKADGKLDGATAALAEAIEADSNFATPYAVRADILRERGQCDQAIADYDRLIQLMPERAAATYVSRGSCFAQNGAYDPALESFDEAIRRDPKNVSQIGALAWVMKGSVHSLKGDRDRANADYDQAIKLDPNNTNGIAARAWNLKASLHFDGNDADSAIADYDAAIGLDPQNANLYLDRGTVWGSKREFSRAIADFDQAIKLDPDNGKAVAVPAWNLKGRAQATQGDIDGAIASFDEAIRLDPKFALAYQNRGDAFKEKGEYARASENYDQAIDLQVKDTPVYASRGLMRFYLGDFPKAATDFTRVAQGQVDAYSLLLLYISLARSGQDAKDALTRYVSRLESKSWPYPVLELFLNQRSLDAARAATGNADQQCELQYYAGEWQLLAGKREPAHAALQAAVDSCPKNFVEYRAAVAELKRWSP